MFAHRGPSARLIDLHGETLLPGFVDGHSHFGSTAFGRGTPTLYPPPVGEVTSIADIQHILKGYMDSKHLSAGEAVTASGYDDGSRRDAIPLGKTSTPLLSIVSYASTISPDTSLPTIPLPSKLPALLVTLPIRRRPHLPRSRNA